MTVESSIDNGQKLFDTLVAMFGPDASSTAAGLVKGLFRRHWSISKHPADAAAGTALELPFDVLESDGPAYLVESVQILPAAALTGDGANNATITLEYDDGAGGANVVVATITTTASWVAQTPVTVTITAANARVAAGKQLIFKIAKNGTGVAVPACVMFVKARPIF